jgi:flagellar basal-body rod modification protein FlgD
MSQINGFSPLDAATRSLPNQFSEMSSEDFLRIIFTELTNQDPLKPSDSSALLQQLSTIRSIESDLKLTQQLDKLVQGNQLASAGNLIGKFIGGLTEDFHGVAGWVVAVLKQGNAVYLELDTGWILPLDNVQTVIDPSLLPEEPPVIAGNDASTSVKPSSDDPEPDTQPDPEGDDEP